MVTDWGEYNEMLQSFLNKGFDRTRCEYLHIDNSTGNTIEAYKGINLFLRQSKGEFIIVCHQDVLLLQDDLVKLQQKICLLEKMDANWAVCGNAGALGPNNIVYHISYPDGAFANKGSFPHRVTALDENFLVIKNSALLSVSDDLEGFHLYAVDLCLHAELNGKMCYAIDFHLLHKSRGKVDQEYLNLRRKLIQKYNSFFRTRWIQTPTTVFHLSGNWLERLLLGNAISLFFARMYNGLKKRLKR
ncbi:glycosyltransferase [Olivibacter ginsenosidimutans]|uniref:Glycosyltransferase n=1 Tax=Olivibacter ginsenosidimutans TaxID=1176537 RepID=A0ABP9AI28_9SPHI